MLQETTMLNHIFEHSTKEFAATIQAAILKELRVKRFEEFWSYFIWIINAFNERGEHIGIHLWV